MAELIARCLEWLRLLLNPHPGGRHRAGCGRHHAVARRPRRIVIRPLNPPHLPWAQRRRRRPEVPLDGDATPLVRPYLVAHEQRQRRNALLLATFGTDAPGPYFIHGVEVVA